LIKNLKEYIKDNYLNICNRLSIKDPPKLIFKRVKGYLGQYNKKQHKITLNILIAHLDIDCVEYVIIHELTHVKYMNHQKEFWTAIEQVLPDYKIIRSKCKKEFVCYENY
jgi:predicted metal-dependent hydrolase